MKRVRFWGTRGSLPVAFTAPALRARIVAAVRGARGRALASDADVESYVDSLGFDVAGTFGGHTSCFEIETGGPDYVLCDLGSGVRPFGQAAIAKHGAASPRTYHVFMSHVHWDHMMGLLFFVPAYIPRNRIVSYGGHEELEFALRRQMEPPSFPVDFSYLRAKPNIVSPLCIDPIGHGEGFGNPACTPWAFMAALMRWFHDKLEISYYSMAVGEAGTGVSTVSRMFSLIFNGGQPFPTEALFEGRYKNIYGGWGFYFTRKYLVEVHPADHPDNPMNGYEESISGTYIPPGQASRQLMIYDLNRLFDVPSKWKDVPVPDGAIFKEITLHKVIVGGDPRDAQDFRDYPGCVLVNVPRLKIHTQSLLTNAIKNLGIGLYPMEAASREAPRSTRWNYSFPFKPTPTLKSEIPHATWFAEGDDETGLPLRDEKGNYKATKTAGLNGTMVDIVKAVQNQGVFWVHVVDAIEPVNIRHDGYPVSVKVPEGYAFAALDPVALELFCARYLFKMVPMSEGRKVQKEKSLKTDFLPTSRSTSTASTRPGLRRWTSSTNYGASASRTTPSR